MKLRISVDGEYVEYNIPDAYKRDALYVLQLIREGKYLSAGMHIHRVLKHSRLLH